MRALLIIVALAAPTFAAPVWETDPAPADYVTEATTTTTTTMPDVVPLTPETTAALTVADCEIALRQCQAARSIDADGDRQGVRCTHRFDPRLIAYVRDTTTTTTSTTTTTTAPTLDGAVEPLAP